MSKKEEKQEKKEKQEFDINRSNPMPLQFGNKPMKCVGDPEFSK